MSKIQQSSPQRSQHTAWVVVDDAPQPVELEVAAVEQHDAQLFSRALDS